MTEDASLLSHSNQTRDLESTVARIRHRIHTLGDKPYATVQRQLDLLDALCQFDFGKFLILNRGINGYWTHYMLTHPWFGKKTGTNNRGEPFSPLEDFVLNRAPTVLATQQRFALFLQQNQRKLKNDAVLASIPCGLMGELLYLDYKNVTNVQLHGVDFDGNTLKDAASLSEQLNLSHFVRLVQNDAWHINQSNAFDLISSNGLNVYEPDDNKVTELYRVFYQALKPGGLLVTSFLTPPPQAEQSTEWRLDRIDQEALLLQRILFVDIIDAKWQCFRTTIQTDTQLRQAGFKNIEFIYDEAHIFPTVVAEKA